MRTRFNDLRWGEEFAGLRAGMIGKLFNQALVGAAEHVRWE
jgi:hypothetical protein